MGKKQQDTGTFSNAAEEAELRRINEARERGEDVFGDYDDEPAAAAAPAPAPAAEPAAAPSQAAAADDPPAEDPDGDDEPQAAAAPAAAPAPAEPAQAAAPAAAPAPEPAAPPAQAAPGPVEFQTLTRDELKTQQDALLAKQDKDFAEFDEGTITREEYQKRQRENTQTTMQLAQQAALLEANEQNRLAAQRSTLDRIKTSAKQANLIDYDDEAAAAEFDAALRFVSSVPANQALAFDALADKAHKMVLVQRGVALPAAAPAPASAPAPRVPPAAPITLSQLPAAATPNANGGVDEQLSRLHGQDFEAAIAAMPKDKRDAWMDS